MRLSISTKPVSVISVHRSRRREGLLRQVLCASPSPRGPCPSSLTPVLRRQARFPCTCLSIAAKPFPSVPFPRRNVLALFPLGSLRRWRYLESGLRLQGEVYDYRDGYRRVNYSDQNWEELTRREVEQLQS